MVTTSYGVGFMELLLLTVFGSGGLMGLPPGERDALLVQCPPENAVVYAEWSARGEGQPGAPGIDGLAADPEIRQFVADVERAILETVERETENASPEEKVLAEHVPPLVKLLLNAAGCAYVSVEPAKKPARNPRSEEERWLGIAARVRATLVVNGGGEADEVARHVEALLELVPGDEGEGLENRAIPLPVPDLSLTVHRHGDYVIVGFGAGTVDRAVSGLSEEARGLAGSEAFAAAIEHVEVPRTAGVSWINVRQLTEDLGTLLGPMGAMIQPVMQTLGADKIESVVSMAGVVEGQVVSKTFITTGGSTEGILALTAGRAIKPADLAHIPADADFLTAASLSGPKILAAVREIVGNAAPDAAEMFEGVLEQLETELGFSLEEDVFEGFGDVWTIHDSPQAGGLFISSAVAALEVKDHEKAADVFAQLMKLLEQSLPGEYGQQFWRRAVHLEKHEFMERTVYFINMIGDDIPFAPAFCLTETHLLAAPHPQAIKAHLRFVDEEEEHFGSRLEDEDEGETIALSHTDGDAVMRYLVAISPYVGQMVFSQIQRSNVEIDVFSLPSGRALLPYLGDSHSSVTRTEDGLLIESRSALPIPGGGTVMMQVPIWFSIVLPARVMHAPPAVQFEDAEAVPVP